MTITAILLLACSLTAQNNIYTKLDDSLAKHYSAMLQKESLQINSGSREQLAKASSELGGIYFRKGYYMEAFNSYLFAMQVAEDDKFDSLLPEIYNGIGNIYCTWNDFPQGLNFYKKALKYSGNTGNTKAMQKSLINLFGAHYILNQTEEARKYFRKLQDLPLQDSLTHYFFLQNKGLLLQKEHRFKEASESMKKAASYAEKHAMDISLRSSAYSYLAKFKEEENLPNQALAYWKKSLGSNPSVLPPYIQRDIFKQMSKLYLSIGRTAEAATYSHRYLLLTDSLFEEENINRVKDTQLMYETGKAYNTINRLNAEKQEKELQLHMRNKILLVVAIGIMLLGLLSALLYLQKRKLNQAYKSLFTRNRELLEALEATPTAAINNPQQKTDETDKARIHSVDKLTDRQYKEIEQAIKKVLEESDEIFDCNFNIERLADMTGYNSRYISHVMNERFHQNFRSVINIYRIREAQKRLLDTSQYGNYTIQAIAQSVGYKSHANFILLFKKHVGMTPSLYHKMAKE